MIRSILLSACVSIAKFPVPCVRWCSASGCVSKSYVMTIYLRRISREICYGSWPNLYIFTNTRSICVAISHRQGYVVDLIRIIIIMMARVLLVGIAAIVEIPTPIYV